MDWYTSSANNTKSCLAQNSIILYNTSSVKILPVGLLGLMRINALNLMPSSLAFIIDYSNSSKSIYHFSSDKWYPYILILDKAN